MNCTGVVILLPTGQVRAWVLTLADALRSALVLPVSLQRLDDDATHLQRLPLESLECRLLGTASPTCAKWISTGAFPPAATRWNASLVISALERDPRELPAEFREATILAPLFDGGYCLDGLFGSVLNCRSPGLGIVVVTPIGIRLVHAAQVAIPDGELTPRAIAAVLARLILLLRDACQHILQGKPVPPANQAVLDSRPLPVRLPRLQRIVRTYIPKGVDKFSQSFSYPQDWCIAYRRATLAVDSTDIDLADPNFSIIASGQDEFFADPMLFQYRETTALFFEHFDYRVSRARISFFIMGDNGIDGEPVEALSRPYHLSYPFIFQDTAGTVLMVPETSYNRTVELYEAVEFPAKWRLRSILLENINASDATVYFDDETCIWWMFTSISEYGESGWDSLSIFFSNDVGGPWQPHVSNPVKFDPRCSRPGGPLVKLGGRLLRPAQDCSHGYGGQLVWCEIKELTPARFREETVTSLSPTRGYTGIHCYSRAAGFEAIDLKRSGRRRIPGLRHEPRRNRHRGRPAQRR